MNSKRKKIGWLIVGLILLTGIGGAAELLMTGKQIDELEGVPVYYNGLIYTRIHGSHSATDGYYYGKKWQCVEFIKRYYHDHYGHSMPEVYGHAKDFFDMGVGHGKLNKARGLVQYYNEKAASPRVGDLMVWNDTKYGHVAIVSALEEGSIEVTQQNIYWKSRQLLPWVCEDNVCTVGKKRKPVGWLRLP